MCYDINTDADFLFKYFILYSHTFHFTLKLCLCQDMLFENLLIEWSYCTQTHICLKFFSLVHSCVLVLKAYLVKTSITHNKYVTPQLLQDIDPISAKSSL